MPVKLEGVSLLVFVVAVAGVLWVSKGAMATLTNLPLVSQALQVLGLIYAAQLVWYVLRNDKVQWPSQWPTSNPLAKWPEWNQLWTTAPAATPFVYTPPTPPATPTPAP